MALSTDPVKRDCQVIRYKAIKAGMTEEQYKDWLNDQFGVASATELTATKRKSAHGRLNALLLATGKERPSETAWRDPQIHKLEALWNALATAGAVRVRERAALEAWCKRQQPAMSALRFASGQQLSELIEALKKWERRVMANQPQEKTKP
ncbi:regulatory protein GemA [Collimonas antrihumi]|uniref:regulatory protein GemA n=1 Tax=Collimonas antrihumi TaxID=1940615 RepID=UPI001B8C73B8|nr:regulatory protein GemA [Collimonas antrihumi]